jgi:hypothetical protein
VSGSHEVEESFKESRLGNGFFCQSLIVGMARIPYPPVNTYKSISDSLVLHSQTFRPFCILALLFVSCLTCDLAGSALLVVAKGFTYPFRSPSRSHLFDITYRYHHGLQKACFKDSSGITLLQRAQTEIARYRKYLSFSGHRTNRLQTYLDYEY